MGEVEIKQVVNSNQQKAFIQFPNDLYRTDGNYVPELYLASKDLLNKKKNPYFKHSDASLFLAYRGGQLVGRIAATLNTRYNEFHACNVGFFGFFDCIEDLQVAKILLDQAEDYLNSFNVDQIIGPTNFSTNDTAGVLVEGFDSPPFVQMTYNKPYYRELLEACGYQKEMDLYAYRIPTATANEKSIRLSSLIKERLQSKGISFRSVNMKKFSEEIVQIKEIYKKAWEKNWGFVPPTDEEFDFLAEGLKLVLDERYNYVAQHQGKMVGFAVGLPNINEITRHFKDGRLLPFNIFRLLFGKSKVKNIRIVLLGVIPEYRKMGIEAVFFADYITAAKKNGLESGEASWILENNLPMRTAAEHLNGEKYKTYRLFSKKLKS